MIGLLYSGIECVIEGHRGRHDVYNSLYTGALTGGLLARGSAFVYSLSHATLFTVMDTFLNGTYHVVGLLQGSS